MGKTKKTIRKKERSPRWANIILSFFAKLYLFLFCRVKYNRKAIRKQKEGFILVFNHYSNLDAFLIPAATNYRRINFVITGYFFFNPVIARLLDLDKAIKKDQFKPDMVAIRRIKKVLDENGVVAIAPTGQVSLTGKLSYVSDAIVKLVRLGKKDVIALRMQGSHLHKPKWGIAKRNCPMNLTFSRVIEQADIEKMSDEEIYDAIISSININEYADQQTLKRYIRGKNLTSGLENILITCPKCYEKYHIESEKHELYCTKCGNRVVMDRYGFMKPKTKSDVAIATEIEWYEWQENEIKKRYLNDNFYFESAVRLLRNARNERSLDDAGTGKLILTGDKLYYDGTCYGESIHKEFRYDKLIQLPFGVAPVDNAHFEIPDEEGVFMFKPVEERRIVIEWVQLVDVINKLNHSGTKGEARK